LTQVDQPYGGNTLLQFAYVLAQLPFWARFDVPPYLIYFSLNSARISLKPYAKFVISTGASHGTNFVARYNISSNPFSASTPSARDFIQPKYNILALEKFRAGRYTTQLHYLRLLEHSAPERVHCDATNDADQFE
jgi:hypothetical protein